MTHICHTVVPGTSVTHSVVSHTVCVSHTLLHHTLNVCVSHTSHSGAYQWVIQQWWHTSITHWSLGPVCDIDRSLGPVCDIDVCLSLDQCVIDMSILVTHIYHTLVPGTTDTYQRHTGPSIDTYLSHTGPRIDTSITHFYHRLDLSPTDSITHWSLGPQTHIIDTLVPI